MRPSILVTGGAGYIGSHVCKALAAAGWLPVCYDDLSNGHNWAVRWGPLEVGDVRDRVRLNDVMARHQPQAVLHFAGLIEAGRSVVQPLRFFDVNVGGTIALLQAMEANGIGKLVFSSTAAVYGDLIYSPADERHPRQPVNPYGRSKLAAEQIVEDFGQSCGLTWAALRYFNASGADPNGELGEAHDPETHLIPLTIQAAMGLRPAIQIFGQDYPTPDGTCIRDYIHVSDLADAHVRALHHLLNGGAPIVCNLGTGAGISVRQIIDAVARVSGRPVPVKVVNRRPGDPAILVADSRDGAALLGWRPKRSDIESIVADAWHWAQAGHANIGDRHGRDGNAYG